MTNELTQYAIYEHPEDYPEHYVVRAWHAVDGEPQPDRHCYLAKTLDEARTFVPPGFVLTQPAECDVPTLKEVWI